MGGLVIVSKITVGVKTGSQRFFAVSNLIIKSFGYTYVLLGTILAYHSHIGIQIKADPHSVNTRRRNGGDNDTFLWLVLGQEGEYHLTFAFGSLRVE
jgi:hypothetical protein